jgi:hypothetical protein
MLSVIFPLLLHRPGDLGYFFIGQVVARDGNTGFRLLTADFFKTIVEAISVNLPNWSFIIYTR